MAATRFQRADLDVKTERLGRCGLAYDFDELIASCSASQVSNCSTSRLDRQRLKAPGGDHGLHRCQLCRPNLGLLDGLHCLPHGRLIRYVHAWRCAAQAT